MKKIALIAGLLMWSVGLVKAQTQTNRNYDTTTLKAAMPAGAKVAHPNQKVLIQVDSAITKDPFDQVGPGEMTPEDPAPGLHNANRPRKRYPSTDKKYEPR